MTDRTPLDELLSLHQREPFPPGLAGEEVLGVDLVMLDADVAGCVSYFCARGALDEKRAAILASCTNEITAVLDRLPRESRPYFARLKEMSDLVHKQTSGTPPSET